MRRTLFRCAKQSGTKTVSVLSVPVNLGQPFMGPDRAPELLKEHGLNTMLASSGYRIVVEPDILSTDFSRSNVNSDKFNARNCEEVGFVCEKIYHRVKEHAETENFLLILGGDHCIPIGTIPAIISARKDTGIVWVDAHADINVPATSGSGNMHGMPVSFLMGLVENAASYPSMQWFKPCITPKDVVYIGLRDLDEPEKQLIKTLGIKAFTMYDIDKLGIGKVMEQTNDYLAGRNLHLSFDIDALDPFYAPHTGTAVRGGLTFREGVFLCESLAETGRLTSMELVEVNPSLHTDINPKRTIEMGLALIGSTIGQTIL